MNAVIYARYSSHSQTEQSIEGQLHDNHAWAKQQGYTVIAEYIDRALSGTKDTRPDFQRMIADAAKKQFEIVIVWKLDRFARNRYDSAIYKAKLKKYGVRVVSVKEQISDTPEGIILEGLLESMAEYYSSNLAQNIRRGQRESALKGQFRGGQVPFGYKIIDHKLAIDEKTAPCVRYVFESYANGMGKKEIADELNRRGLRTKTGNSFTVKSFSTLLSNVAYIGTLSYGDIKIPDAFPALIDKELFERVQLRLKSVARAPAANKAKVRYLLQGKAFCGLCGAPLIGESGYSHTGVMHSYYACAVKKKTHACKKKNERRAVLEEFVISHTISYVLNPSNINRIAEAVVAEYEREFSPDTSAPLEKALESVHHDMNKLVDALIDAPKSAQQAIYARMEALEAQQSELESEIARLKIAQGIRLTESEVKSWLKDFTRGSKDDPAFCQHLIDTFVNAIYVYDDKIIIFYNIRTNSQISFSELSTAPSDLNSSDLNSCAPLKSLKSEPRIVFIKGVIGFIFQREEN